MKAERVPHEPPSPEGFELRLYITGTRPQSLRALKNIKTFCEKRLKGQYSLQVVDLYQQPDQAAAAQVIAAPTLVKMQPLPVRRMIGDMSDENQMINGLELPPSHE